MSSVKLTADSGGGTVELKAPATTTSNAAKVVTLSQNPGMITQVVQTIKSDTTSLSSTSTFTDISGMSVAITPSSSSNKILVQFNVNISNLSNGHVDVRLLRGSTAIAVGDASSSRARVSISKESAAHGNGMEERTMMFLDSPATTSATTYKLQWKTGGVDAVLNRSKDDSDDSSHPRGVSTITAMEVAG